MLEVTAVSSAQFHEQLNKRVADGLLVLDRTQNITSANHTAAAILGYKQAELVGAHLSSIWPHAGTEWQSITPLDAHREQTTLQRKNGRLIPVQLTLSCITQSTTDPVYLMTITSIDDITQLNEALAHTQRLASLGTLTASIAHELNTPISIITATCSNLLYEMEDNQLTLEQLLQYVRMIEENAWRSARILEVLRNYSYNARPQFDVTNLNMVVEDALTLVRHQFRSEYNLIVEKALDENLPTLVCDHHRMTQILLNLLNNASDATPRGGTIRIQTWMNPADETAHHYGHDQQEFGLSVSDSGHGIDEETMPHIFEPFFTTKPHGKGTGLGLYIARKIVDQHNGRIWAENNPDGGATFTVILPRKQNPED